MSRHEELISLLDEVKQHVSEVESKDIATVVALSGEPERSLEGFLNSVIYLAKNGYASHTRRLINIWSAGQSA